MPPAYWAGTKQKKMAICVALYKATRAPGPHREGSRNAARRLYIGGLLEGGPGKAGCYAERPHSAGCPSFLRGSSSVGSGTLLLLRNPQRYRPLPPVP